MKHDPYYKYLAAVIIAGVLIALFESTPSEEVAPVSVAAAVTSR